MVKKILLLGASGSIGRQTLDVIKQNPDAMALVGFSVGNQIDVAIEILRSTEVKYCWVAKQTDQIYLSQTFKSVKVFSGSEGLLDLVRVSQAEWVVNALMGFAGFRPTLLAIELGKNIALANKETLVAGGQFIMEAVSKYGVKLTPIDSEHSAIYQCLIGHTNKEVKRIYITASGGAFRDLEHNELQGKRSSDALKHPNWSMGQKITIDSATMMNKGLEVIEAHWLFGLDYDQIEVLIQPESIIHSMVEFNDTSVMAQMASSDMRLPIQMALSDETHNPLNITPLDFSRGLELVLKPVKKGRYPLFELALQMGRKGGIAPAVMNGANEVAVEAFLKDKISYYDLEMCVIKACKQFENRELKSVEDVLEADALGRRLAHSLLEVE